MTAAVCGLGYPAFQLAAVFAKRVYHVGPGRYGALTGAFGVGALLGALWLSLLGGGRARSEVVRLAVAIYGAAIVGFGLSRTFWQGVVMLGMMGLASLPVIANLNTAIQTQVPEHLRGRVLGLWIVGYTTSYPLGALVQGWLADRVGPGPTVTGAGVLMCLVAAVLFVHPAITSSLDEHVHRGDPVTVAPEPTP